MPMRAAAAGLEPKLSTTPKNDQGQHAAEQHAVHRPPPTADGGAVGAGKGVRSVGDGHLRFYDGWTHDGG